MLIQIAFDFIDRPIRSRCYLASNLAYIGRYNLKVGPRLLSLDHIDVMGGDIVVLAFLTYNGVNSSNHLADSYPHP